MAEDQSPLDGARGNAVPPTGGSEQPRSEALGSTGKVAGAPLRFFQWARTSKEEWVRHPIKNAAYTVAVFFVGMLATDAYVWAKVKVVGEDSYLEDLRADQAAGFSKLEEALTKLRGSVSGSDRDLVRQVEEAAQRIDAAQGRLVQQLELGKSETQRLSQALQAANGLRGGYDFMLNESSGFSLSRSTTLGVSDFHYDKAVKLNLSSIEGESLTDKSLEPGQSLPFKNDRGQACIVSVVSIENKTASFKVSCPGGPSAKA